MSTKSWQNKKGRRRGAIGSVLVLTVLATILAPLPAQAAHSAPIIPDAQCSTNTLPRNDDGSTNEVALPFGVNFFGVPYGGLYVNNNGNVTFGQSLSEFTPFELTADTPPIIAPFLADVDTRGAGSAEVTYGTILGSAVFGGRDVFCANWRDVGYYASHDDKLNDFQLLMVDRGDVAPGDFDIYFNYGQILWETGDASSGIDGFGGTSAGAGYAGGTGEASNFFELPCSRVISACLDSNEATGLHNTSTNSTLAGRHIFSIRSGGETFAGAITGTVTDGVSPLEGAFVQVCRQAFCPFTGLTSSTGGYQAANLQPGTYQVSVNPPGDLSPQSQTVELADDEELIVDFVIQAPEPPPAGTSIDDDTPPGQIPSVVVGQPVTLRTLGCIGGTATYEIVGERGMISGSLVEGPDGTYTATFAIPFTGPAEVDITIVCSDLVVEEIVFDIYIDPSGFVRTVEGEPVVGASVTLYRSDTEVGPFGIVPDGSVVMSPSNRVNPDTTDDTGHFGWDVVAGFYFVQAEAEGCVDPADSSLAFVNTAVLTIPPPVTDLDIRLDCDDTEPPPPDDALTIDTNARTSPTRARLTGSLDCDDASRYRIAMTLTQGENRAEGVATGTCSGENTAVRVVVALRAGSGLVPGPARVCAVTDIGSPSTRSFTTEEGCTDIVLS